MQKKEGKKGNNLKFLFLLFLFIFFLEFGCSTAAGLLVGGGWLRVQGHALQLVSSGLGIHALKRKGIIHDLRFQGEGHNYVQQMVVYFYNYKSKLSIPNSK